MKKRFLYSFFKNIRFKTLRRRQIHVYRNGHIRLHKTAQLILNDCYLFVNKCNFPNIYKPIASVIWIEKNGKFTLKSDHYTLSEGAKIHVRENANLTIEGKGMINTMTEIDVYERIFIGHGTIISSNCYITDSDQHNVIENGEMKGKTKPIKIGRNVWIGRNVTILKGVEIGDHAIVGAGSIVTKSIPPHTLFTGVSARKIKEGVSWKF
jgi:acetyltransferase-like isoleucine patch superfamily enzyme